MESPKRWKAFWSTRAESPRVFTFLKPLSAAVAIGTGGPFGAEGPIIATGGALGSLVGQILETTPQERKTLLAAGAAAGMAATFGTPVSAVLLAIELLLFEFRPRSFIPVAFAAATAAGVRFLLGLPFPCFSSIELANPAISALIVYAIIGAIVGVAAIGATRAVYLIEDLFEKLPLHWMYWPALGAVAVGIVGIFQPRTLGVGYDNIGGELTGQFTLAAVISLCIWKFISWAIALGSGTSGGTLAPLLTIGGGLGFALGRLGILFFPHAGIVPEMAALVGMAALFAGASRAMLASIIFAFEATLRPLGILPVLAGCSTAFLVSCLFMSNTIMTEKIARRGVRAPAEFEASPLAHASVSQAATPDVVTLCADERVADVRQRLNTEPKRWGHQGYPIVNEAGNLVGILTRRDLLDPSYDPNMHLREIIKRLPVVVHPDVSLLDAAEHMSKHDVGRLPVVDRQNSQKVIGIITRGDLLKFALGKSHESMGKS